jgi:hypothetical protein
MMKATFQGLIGIAFALGISTVVSAKGETTRITISGSNLANPIEITDAGVVRQFQVWSGPGTSVCTGNHGDCVNGTEGFIADWLSGAAADRPSGLQRYEVSFYVNDARATGSQPGPERLAYVVSYEYDARTSRGYVYLPGKDDRWYPLNAATIYRDREGTWFHATRAWQDAVVPLVSNATESFQCEVTKPNGKVPAGSSVPGRAAAFYGNESVATTLWADGTITFRPDGPGFVLPDGSLQMKFLWAKTRHPMTIEGRRLDAPAPPLRSDINHQFDSEDFQPSALIFPTPGCWEVTSHVGQSALTFVTRVVKIGEGPSQLR